MNMEKNMKIKINQVILLTILLTIFLTGTLPSLLISAEKELSVALILWRGETLAEQGFKGKLTDLGYSVKYTTYNAKQKRSNLGRDLRHDLVPALGSFDYIYSFGTTSTQMTKSSVQGKVPPYL